MVRGLDVFTQWFKGFSDQYVLIGGTAASLAMKEFGVPFRGTKDLDVVFSRLSPISMGEDISDMSAILLDGELRFCDGWAQDAGRSDMDC